MIFKAYFKAYLELTIDVGDELHFLAGVYLSAIVAKYLFKVSATISESEVNYCRS